MNEMYDQLQRISSEIEELIREKQEELAELEEDAEFVTEEMDDLSESIDNLDSALSNLNESMSFLMDWYYLTFKLAMNHFFIKYTHIMIQSIQQIPADYFLHFFGAGILFLHFWHVYSFKGSLIILAAFSIIKEVYDYLYGTGFSIRDIFMNLLGVLVSILVVYVYQSYLSSKIKKMTGMKWWFYTC